MQVDIFDIQIPEGERRLAPAGSFEYIHWGRIWRTYDSQGPIIAVAFKYKSLRRF